MLYIMLSKSKKKVILFLAMFVPIPRTRVYFDFYLRKKHV